MRPSVWVVASVLGARAVAASPLELPEPPIGPRVEIAELSPSPTYYRLPPQTTHFLSRASLGLHAGRPASGESIGVSTDFALDVLMGAALRFDRRATTALWIEGGYSYVKGREHWAVAGLGVGRRARGFGRPVFALVPHALAGSIDGRGAVGVRTSAIAGFAVYAIELAHQVAIVDGAPVHELHAVLSFPFLAGLE